tara:strand:+ start:2359 stop:3009 length:651 start_codon:yes stop_codon:yes gene_type:complete
MSVKSSSKNRCLYCNQFGHTIKKCKKDAALFNNINLNKFREKTSLSNLDKKYLQRLAVQLQNISKIDEDGMIYYQRSPISFKLPKKQMVNILHVRITDNLAVLHQHKEILKKEKQSDCPICYEKMGNHTCTTTCGHEMCTGCFSKIFLHARPTSGPSCPMCRASLVPSDFRRESTSRPSAEERERERQQWQELQAMEDNMERIRNQRTSGNILGLR